MPNRARTIVQFGHPALRKKPARRFEPEEIASEAGKSIIMDIRNALDRARERYKYGIGLAAPQIGIDAAVSVIDIRPSKLRPEIPPASLTIVNPEIIKTYGDKVPKWEGCMSLGRGPSSPYAQAMRYEKVRVRFYDENARLHEEDYDGLLGHVLQHEIDHLNGILFVDRVEDTKTYMTMGEFRKRLVPKLKSQQSSGAAKQP